MIHLVDASGLAALPQLVAPDDHLELWNGLTKAVEDQRLRLSSEVRDELNGLFVLEVGHGSRGSVRPPPMSSIRSL
jgi:hypothetical protein